MKAIHKLSIFNITGRDKSGRKKLTVIGKNFPGGLKRKEEVTGDGNNPVEDMVADIKMLGDGFMRIETMNMDMARDLESMRMEMEVKWPEMNLNSQQRLVDLF